MYQHCIACTFTKCSLYNWTMAIVRIVSRAKRTRPIVPSRFCWRVKACLFPSQYRALKERSSNSKHENDVENYAFLSLVLIHHSSIKSIAYPTSQRACSCSSATCNESTFCETKLTNWSDNSQSVSAGHAVIIKPKVHYVDLLWTSWTTSRSCQIAYCGFVVGTRPSIFN